MPLKRPTVCVACRTRKVKCVRPPISDDGRPSAACEFCMALQIECQDAPRTKPGPKPHRHAKNPAFSRGRHKRGKRIVALLDEQQDDTGSPTAASIGQRVTASASGAGDSPSTNLSSDASSQPPSAHYSPNRVTPSSHPHPRSPPVYDPGELKTIVDNFANLSRSALDACVSAYLNGTGRVFKLSMPNVLFWQRYEYLVCLAFGQPLPPDLVENPPLRISPLLVLCIAVRGAQLTDSYQHLVGTALQYCVQLMKQAPVLVKDGADAVESVHVFTQGVHSVFAVASEVPDNPLLRHPMERGFAVELALFHRMNEIPSLGSVDEIELKRRRGLFYIICIYDAIRSLASGRMYRIAGEDICWPMDPYTLRQSPWGAILLSARQLCRDALSPRARINMSIATAHDLLDLLYITPVRFGVSPDLPQDEQAWFAMQTQEKLDVFSSDEDYQCSTLAEKVTLLSCWNWFYLVLWIAIRRNDSVRESQAGRRADEAAFKATVRMGHLAAACLRDESVLPRAPRLVRDQFASFLLWITRILSRSTIPSHLLLDQPNLFLHNMADTPLDPSSEVPHEQAGNWGNKKAQLMSIATTLVQSVKMMRASPGSDKLADILQDVVHRVSTPLRPPHIEEAVYTRNGSSSLKDTPSEEPGAKNGPSLHLPEHAILPNASCVQRLVPCALGANPQHAQGASTLAAWSGGNGDASSAQPTPLGVGPLVGENDLFALLSPFDVDMWDSELQAILDTCPLDPTSST